MPENQTKPQSNSLIPGIMLILYIISIGISFKIESSFKNGYYTAVDISHKQLMDSLAANNIEIATARAENRMYQMALNASIRDRSNIVLLQKQISKSYEKLQEDIKSVNDTMLIGVTMDLLAKHRAKPLERN